MSCCEAAELEGQASAISLSGKLQGGEEKCECTAHREDRQRGTERERQREWQS